jgi:hypothetical protein
MNTKLISQLVTMKLARAGEPKAKELDPITKLRKSLMAAVSERKPMSKAAVLRGCC